MHRHHPETKHTRTPRLQLLHLASAFIYVLAILFLGILLTFFASHATQTRLLQKSHDATIELSLYLQNKNQELWQVYLPIYTENKIPYSVTDLFTYGSSAIDNSPEKRQALIHTLEKMAYASPDISWILLAPNSASSPLLYFSGSGVLENVPANFPFTRIISEHKASRMILGTQTVINSYKNRNAVATYAIITDFYTGRPTENLGSIVIGFETSALDKIYNSYFYELPTEITVATLDGSIVYNSSGDYNQAIDPALYIDYVGQVAEIDGQKFYIENAIYQPENYIIFNRIPYHDMILESFRPAISIWGLCFFLASLSLVLYIITGRLSARKVNTILDGLEKIKSTDSSYQLPVSDANDEFDIIAAHINHTAKQLRDNVEKSYQYSLKQKNAELGELQAKFNPHFLYNCLEIIRSQLQQNGDLESADMVLWLSQIFRNFLNPNSFVKIQDELSLCNMYIHLLQMRYKDEFEVEFDIDSDILEYGIIRNLLQPIIENYFVHGFDETKEQNRITISGHTWKEEYILLQIEDNGIGMDAHKLTEIQTLLREDSSDSDNSYGLKNVNDRIMIFYGDDCGLQIESEAGEHTVIQVLIKKMTCEEHISKFKV